MSTSKYSGNFCRLHIIGRDVGEAIKYDPTCVTCVRLRGHLPEDQRDQPGFSAIERTRKSPYLFLPADPNRIIAPYKR